MFDKFSIDKYKYLKYPKSGSMKELQELMALNDIPLNSFYANKFDKISPVFERIFEKRRLSYPRELVGELIVKSKPVILKIKNYHNRTRPYKAAEKFGIKVEQFYMSSAQTPAFPSGHSAQAKLIANVLSDLHPVHTAEFQQAAKNISNSRLAGHVHYKSDTDAGEKLGDDLYEHYKKNA